MVADLAKYREQTLKELQEQFATFQADSAKKIDGATADAKKSVADATKQLSADAQKQQKAIDAALAEIPKQINANKKRNAIRTR